MGNSSFSVYNMTGLMPVESNYTSPQPTQHLAFDPDDNKTGVAALVDPDNPLLWVGLLLGATVGLVGLSGSVRLGKARVSASLDKS